MNKLDILVFNNLFKKAHLKCFGYELKKPLTEPEGKQFSNEVFEHTGLVIGWKSIKNYSFYITQNSGDKQENPSISTLDTLSRYVLNAPLTNEIKRKDMESHYPYWFQYREQFYPAMKKVFPLKKLLLIAISSGLAILVFAFIIKLIFFQSLENKIFTDTFKSIEDDTLVNRGWIVTAKDIEYWNRRGEKPGHLTLFTLKGDNWPDPQQISRIKNLLVRKIHSKCFTAEIHLSEFIPSQNWQQAGLILLEDTNYSAKSLRLSLGFNDFSAGAPIVQEIIIQAITTFGNHNSKPEEIIHKQIFNLETDLDFVIKENLKNSSLRIEKYGKKYRFLFSDGPMKNSAFKELAIKDLDINPTYIGLFALKGFVDSTANMPVYFNFFSLEGFNCEK